MIIGIEKNDKNVVFYRACWNQYIKKELILCTHLLKATQKIRLFNEIEIEM